MAQKPRNPKSISLPKLSTDPSSSTSTHNLKKPLKQFHKVNWSIAPHCLIEGHEGEPVIYVCVRRECECLTRLVCEQCFYREHAGHNKNFMAIDEVKMGRVKGLRYWPFQAEFKPIFQFIKAHDAYMENLITDIKSTYQNLLTTVTQAILQTRDKHLSRIQKFYTKQTTKQSYIHQLTHTIEKVFNFKQIQNCVRQVFNKQMRHQIFTKKMNGIMRDNSHIGQLQKLRKQFYDEGIDKGRDIRFDMVYFIKKQKILLRDIGEIDNAVVEEKVVVDEAAVGVETIIVQTVEYLKKASQGMYPLTYDEKQLEDGTYYIGFLSKGNRNLLGIRDYRNGFIYYGEWRTNCRNGWGVYQHKENGYRYAGNWREDKKNGYGKEITATYTYEGNFLNDKKDGFGSIRQDGVRYDITWKNDKKNGKGKRIDANGESQVYFLNGIESQMKGGIGSNVPGEGQKRDVNFLARMFGNGGQS